STLTERIASDVDLNRARRRSSWLRLGEATAHRGEIHATAHRCLPAVYKGGRRFFPLTLERQEKGGSRDAMIKVVFLALFVSVLLAASGSTSAEASDFCLRQTSKPELSFVLKNFKMPRRGKCAQFGGWCGNCVNDDMLTGTACTFSDGTRSGSDSRPRRWPSA